MTMGVGPAPEGTCCDQLKALIQAEPKDGPQPFWLVLIGHGTFDGHEARFNLRGPDGSEVAP